MGSITLITGCMFSGKTTEGIKMIENARINNKKCLIIKYAKDDRYNNNYLTTHDMYIYDKIETHNYYQLDLLKILEIIKEKYEVVLIDEGQFFKNIHIYSQNLKDNNIEVIISALDKNYKKEAFGDIPKLLECSDKIKKLYAKCNDCKNMNGELTFRTIDNDNEELIGGQEYYIPLCIDCYDDRINLNNKVKNYIKKNISNYSSSSC